MDKHESETWEEYVFRKDFATISYSAGTKTISYIRIPDELGVATSELYRIRYKYGEYRYDIIDEKKCSPEDIIYWKWLINRKSFLENEQYKKKSKIQEEKQAETDKLHVMNYVRYKELVTVLSETTHKEQLEEILHLREKISYCCQIIPPKTYQPDYDDYCKEKSERDKKLAEERKIREESEKLREESEKLQNEQNIEAYKNYKNKEIQSKLKSNII